MVKQHMSSMDVAAQVACLQQKLLGLRVANVYDLNARTYLLKLARSGEDGEKVFLVLESGVRFHTTQVQQNKADVPSNFSLKLRKHMRTKRLDAIRQLGVDRIVDFTFGSGEVAVHLILEMYAQGNIVLTDSKYEVLTLLRSHRDDDKGLAIMARYPYPMNHVRLRTRVTAADVQGALATAPDRQDLKGVVAQLLGYGPAIAEHVVRDAGLDPSSTAAGPGGAGASGTGTGAGQPLQLSPDQLQALDGALSRLDAWFAGLESASPPGLITCLPAGGKVGGGRKAKAAPAMAAAAPPSVDAPTPTPEAASAPLVYHEFHAIAMHQSEGLHTLSFPTFDAALDEFFSKVAGQRAQTARSEAERQAFSKLDKFKTDQAARAAAFAKEAEEAELRGSLIEYNLEAVDAVITALNASLATGMDWHDLDRLIKDERKAGNPVAAYIHSLQLDQNRATLLLSNHLDTEEEGDEAANARKATKVTIDLGLSAHANAAVHYGAMKKHAQKQARTVAANEMALKAAEQKAAAALSKVRAAPTTAVIRKPLWFERFAWFISSENYLVISGRDAQQNELIVKRYFKRGDVYVHAELHGASSTIVKNPHPDLPVPPGTLQQAGCACVCRSRAWDSKIVTSAWWVQHHQVSKTAPTGEYLPTGSFMVRGRKNFLPPQPLVFGIGFLFKLEDACIPAHVGERAVRAGVDNDTISLGMTMHDPGEPVDDGLSDPELSALPDEQEEDSQASALDRFMSGSYGPSLGTAASGALSLPSAKAGPPSGSRGQRLSRQALEAVGGAPSAAQISSQYQRYGLDTEGGPGSPSDDAPGNDAPPAAPRQAPQKSGSQQQQQQHRKGARAGGGGPKPGGGPATQSITPLPAATRGKPVRGKKGKQAKMREKYGEQDEEERALAVALLAADGAKKTRADRRRERKERREAERTANMGAKLGAEDMAEAIAAATRKQYSAGEGSSPSSSGSDAGSSTDDVAPATTTAPPEPPSTGTPVVVAATGPAAGSPAGPQPQSTASRSAAAGDDDPGAQAAQEAEEVAALLAEENLVDMAEEDREKLTVLDSLTGLPRAEDTLLFAIPVCGPYTAVQAYKYKIKLTPGTVKKGKAARQAQELLMRGPEVAVRERDLIKAVPEHEMIAAMVGTVKLSMPGLAKLQAVDRAAKKNAAKNAAASTAASSSKRETAVDT